ncbi:Phage tail fibre repeat [Edwardsiella tarda]|nr:Phage tail fibre repeat [Edwardsiella tarda]
MQKLMPQVDTPDNAFHDGNPATGELGTPVYAIWLNAVQGAVRDIQAECHAILTANGFTPDPSRQNQLWAAIQKTIDSKVPAASTSQAGKVQLSSATDSNSEQTAATSKAVKAVKDYADTKAALNSPAFTGHPTAPTPPPTAKGTELANAEFVAAKIAALVDSSPEALNTLKELADALGDDPHFATTVTKALAGKQPLNSTLTALSGKNVAQLLEYLGLRGTINQAAGALQKTQNGADIPNKSKFIDNTGLRDTVNKANNAVPTSRKINNKALSSDISLTASDVSAFALGRTGDTAATDKGIAWDAPSGVYQASLNGASCMILHFNMG